MCLPIQGKPGSKTPCLEMTRDWENSHSCLETKDKASLASPGSPYKRICFRAHLGFHSRWLMQGPSLWASAPALVIRSLWFLNVRGGGVCGQETERLPQQATSALPMSSSPQPAVRLPASGELRLPLFFISSMMKILPYLFFRE